MPQIDDVDRVAARNVRLGGRSPEVKPLVSGASIPNAFSSMGVAMDMECNEPSPIELIAPCNSLLGLEDIIF